jgi:hypothetical protein
MSGGQVKLRGKAQLLRILFPLLCPFQVS